MYISLNGWEKSNGMPRIQGYGVGLQTIGLREFAAVLLTMSQLREPNY